MPPVARPAARPAAAPAAPVPRTFAFGWAVLFACGAGWVGWLAQYWRANPDAADRFLILLAGGWLLARRRAAFFTTPGTPTRAGLLLLAPAALLIPAAWYLWAQVGPRLILLWWLGLAWLLAVAGLALVHRGAGPLRAVAFPLTFLLFALPLPSRIEQALQTRLQAATTTAADVTLRGLGFSVERQGHVLRLPSGDLGVVEACSGVRSVTAIVAVAALLAHLRRFGAARGLALVVLALPVVSVANAVRVVLGGVLQEWLGDWVNRGTAHEALGVVTLLVGLAGVLAVAHLLRPRRAPDPAAADAGPLPLVLAPPARGGWAAAGLCGFALATSTAGAAAMLLSAPAEEPDAPVEAIAQRVGAWDGTDVTIESYVPAQLECDRVIQRSYRNPAGQRVVVWVIYWTAAGAVKDYTHHPDICWPSRGWTPVASARKPVPLPSGATLGLTARRFVRGSSQQLIYYWAQDGDRPWTEADEQYARRAWPTQAWVLDRLFSIRALERRPRLVVVVGAEVWETGGYGEQAVEEFIRDFAAEVYRVLPWALPKR